MSDRRLRGTRQSADKADRVRQNQEIAAVTATAESGSECVASNHYGSQSIVLKR